MLSYDLQALIGLAIVDGAFQDELLSDPRQAVVQFELTEADRRAASSIHGARSLAEYAARLEERVLGVDHGSRFVFASSDGKTGHPSFAVAS